MKFRFLLFLLIFSFHWEIQGQILDNIPVDTKISLERASSYNTSGELLDVCLIINVSKGSKGTGFIIDGGYIVTNHHVVKGATPSTLVLIFPDGSKTFATTITSDQKRDLAIVQVKGLEKKGMELGDSKTVSIGSQIYSWGYPLGYNSPTPILTVGYLSGFNTIKDSLGRKVVDHLVVNGAFNPGNSGGALIHKGKVIGIVQSKHAPISNYHLSIIEALKNNKSGFQYTKTNDDGTTESFSEGQLVADMIIYFRELTQVMIGEAVTVEELKLFMIENGFN